MAVQKISLKIGGKTYHLNASSPEKEQLLRLAADEVNAQMERFRRKYPSVAVEDILSLTALNEAMAALSNGKQFEKAKVESETLTKNLTAYLSDIKEQ